METKIKRLPLNLKIKKKREYALGEFEVVDEQYTVWMRGPDGYLASKANLSTDVRFTILPLDIQFYDLDENEVDTVV